MPGKLALRLYQYYYYNLDLASLSNTGDQAIHPGYGFLSENPKFVDMVEAAGLKFIGPSSGPMLAMGDKINSKIIAKKVNFKSFIDDRSDYKTLLCMTRPG